MTRSVVNSSLYLHVNDDVSGAMILLNLIKEHNWFLFLAKAVLHALIQGGTLYPLKGTKYTKNEYGNNVQS